MSKFSVPLPTRVFELFPYQLSRYDRRVALARRNADGWQTFSSEQVVSWIDDLAAALEQTGVEPGNRIGNVSETNRPEWNVIDAAVTSLGAVHLPIYPNISADEYTYILGHAEPKLVFVSSERLFRLLESVAERLTCRFVVVPYEPIAGRTSLRDLTISGHTALADPETRSRLNSRRARVRPKDLAMLIYTSGTTGKPKGVMLSHANLMSNCITLAGILAWSRAGRALSFLPLCHIYERTVVNIYIFLGISVFYAESLETISRDLREVRPHVFSTVPRLLEKVYERILEAGDQLTGWRRGLFFWGLRVALAYEPDRKPSWRQQLERLAADFLVYRLWRKAIGGKIHGIICGSAALQPRLARIFWAAGIRIYEGYGPTEASPVIAVNRPKAGPCRLGTVGPVIRGGEVKIAEDGEILYRGPNVMMGYYQQPELTAEAIDGEGWLHTGDVGAFDGPFLRITDRKKEIFKTSGGKYIAPQPIENKLKESRFIAQSMVIGENRKFPAALVVLNSVAVRAYFESRGTALPAGTPLSSIPCVRELIEGEVAKANQHFGHYSQIKRFALLNDEWTVAGGELTPTLKVKRRTILERHADVIDSLYARAEAAKVFSEGTRPSSFAKASADWPRADGETPKFKE
jgi:long-chain acyl-CoA synthetase